ncbi:MAG: alpha-glucan family phosphorylase [Oceanicoccus sp.]|uniref:alpha-glucan family phosphorylase n=1 Tax=Oceanicoccus sp. TaxID=2691044 RepID=UPI0026086069|nr:alpha-glucan family phosphorylase [Oceanicoccus sp.]MDG1772484.1 alpha-glucan family phosphorylase [Oceanicoccus sp.]
MTLKLQRALPASLQVLNELANDIRWSWNHAGDQLWRSIDPDSWQSLKNPYAILQTTPSSRFKQLAEDPEFLKRLQWLLSDRERYLNRQGWYQQQHGEAPLQQVAYFCMEYGLGEALPLYAGGLGILAGDYLKAASDLGVPVVALGLLFDQGYFRQTLDSDGWQQALYPNCDTASLPISPVLAESGEWLQVAVELPGRHLLLRLWQVQVGHIRLYLLDSNHPQNSVADQGICNQLYPAETEIRFIQQLALGVGGWRALRALDLPVDICHLNEAHCALVILERVREVMQQRSLDFATALCLVRAGNILTTHTAVAAAFDRFPLAMVEKYFSVYAQQFSLIPQSVMAPGIDHDKTDKPFFSPITLALNGCIAVNAVSQSHRGVMQEMLSSRYPRWPLEDIPVSKITNGVHVPSWDSAWADQLWTEAAGKDRWLGDLSGLQQAIDRQSDNSLWAFKCEERADLIHYVRQRYAKALIQRGASEQAISAANYVLDPNVLTLGFARRFTDYKRPDLLLKDKQRLARLLCNRGRPVQIIVAGKAHPQDHQGKLLIQEWVAFSQWPALKDRCVFLPDYDIALAQELVQGVDIWINTPRSRWEACGTSGMKVLANGGLNISQWDGWWAEAWQPDYGWAIGDLEGKPGPQSDKKEAQQLYHRLETEVIPAFYQRDTEGLPRQWLQRIRASMAALAPAYSSNRMVREYVDRLYIDSAKRFYSRGKNTECLLSLVEWQRVLDTHWSEIRWGKQSLVEREGGFDIEVQIYLGDVPAQWVRVELYAEQPTEKITLQKKAAMVGSVGGAIYQASVKTERPSWHYTPRIIGWHQEAVVPLECRHILWKD